MPDITQPDTVRTVERRLEGRSQGGAPGHGAAPEQPAKKVVANYEEAAKAKPSDDRITILGIPVEQITPATRAALGGLVAEINFLRGVVNRHEKAAGRKPDPTQNAGPLEPEMFVKALGGMLAQPTPPGMAWTLLLAHVPTYEDIRRSSGLLAANGVLADVAQRLKDFRPASVDPATGTVVEMAAAMANAFAVLGYVGGSNLAALTLLGADQDSAALARSVRAHLTASGYLVSGIDMALVIKVAAAPVGPGESATLALGRVDHLLRTN
ncbi:MAG: hypothetical protein AB7I36_06510 [Rhodospirillaceae bacterium]